MVPTRNSSSIGWSSEQRVGGDLVDQGRRLTDPLEQVVEALGETRSPAPSPATPT
jgi:hypothetical protein